MELDDDIGKKTLIKNCMMSDCFEEECNCKSCGNLICIDVYKWLVPKELRHMLCTISEGKYFGYRCRDCFSKWGKDNFDSEIDATRIVQDICCEHCKTHLGFFLEKIPSKEEEELGQTMYEDKQRRRLPHMTDLERRYDQKPHIANIIVCRNCRNYLN